MSLSAPIRASTGGGPLSAQCPQYVMKVKPVQFGFADKLLTNPEGNAYNTDDVYFRRPVGNDTGTIGWYYSEANRASEVAGNELEDLAEANVATTRYPLMQTLYREDGSGEVVGQTLPGDVWYEEYKQSVPGPDGQPVSQDRVRVVHTARSEVQALDLTTAYDSDQIKAYLAARASEVGLPNPLADTYTSVDPYIRDGFYKQVSQDANGRRSVSYLNEAGQVLISQYYGDQATPITESYSYYDDRGRMVGSRDPKKLVTRYKYDFRGRMLSMDEPDAGITQYVYRKDGSIRFSQNAKQALQNQYSYTHYDQAGRPTQSGEWAPVDASVSIQSLRLNRDLLEARTQDLPAGSTTDVVKTYYDGQESELAPTNGKGNFLMGKVSYSEKLDAQGQPISQSWYSYDERGRVKWMEQRLAGLDTDPNKAGDESKTVAYTYNGQGNVRVVSYQQDQDDAFYHYYEYDKDTRLKAVYTSTRKPDYEADDYTLKNVGEGKDFSLQASYEYYLHGPLKQVVLANGLQKTDYYYTVQGWLKAINNPNDTGNPDDDVFAMQLDYFAGDYEKTGTSIQPHTLAVEDYSGNIQQQQWRTQTPQIEGGGFVANAYQYTYDQRYQLQSAIFGTMNNGTFAKDASDFYSTTQLDYDRNGNITDLYRTKGELETADDFVGKYKYVKKEGIEINQLDKVEGYADYGYNAIGQMVAQESLAGSEAPTQYIRYDVSGKAIAVYGSATQDQVTKQWTYAESSLQYRYYYDERGFRVRKEDKANDRNTYYLRDASGSLLVCD